MMTDITDHKRADELLKQSEEKFSKAFYSAPLLMTISSLDDGTYLEVNDFFLKTSGFTREEVIGRTSVELGWIDPEEREGLIRLINASGNVLSHELTLTAKGGRLVYCLFSGEIILLHGQKRLLSIAIDITERRRIQETFRESEERYRSIYEESSSPMLLIDYLKGRIVDANSAACSYYGYDRSELKGMLISDINTLGDSVFEMFESVMTDGSKLFHFRHCLASGEVREVEVHSSRVSVRGKEYLFSIINDVTEQLMAKEEIRRLNAELELRVQERTIQLEEANKELEAFSYTVSHDLQAPLRHIDAFSEMLLDEYGEKLDEHAKHYLSRVRAGAFKMRNLINDLLDFSRLNRGELVRERIDLSGITRDYLAELAGREPGRHVEVSVQEGLAVMADARLIGVVMENLLANAWKYTCRSDGATICFGCEEIDGVRVFFVRDNGAGFDMTYANRLFKVFQRLHPETEFEGTGVGLATVQRIIRRHYGEIWAEAEIGKGATFRFTLGKARPRAKDDAECVESG